MAQLEAGNQRVTGLDTDTDETFETEMTRRDNPWRAYLTIIEGCDKACSYCVVPYTRGPERSRASESILREVRQLAELGYSEVQLLGQTVNSYAIRRRGRCAFRSCCWRWRTCREFAACASRLRIRAISRETLWKRSSASRSSAITCTCRCSRDRRRVLRAMQRTYTREEYLEKIAMIRGAKRPISITTDIIVGFPGETEEDFEETLSLLDAVQYDGMFSFKYSPRPNTPSLAMPDAIPEEEKSRRLAALQERQREIQSEAQRGAGRARRLKCW